MAFMGGIFFRNDIVGEVMRTDEKSALAYSVQSQVHVTSVCPSVQASRHAQHVGREESRLPRTGQIEGRSF